MSLDELRMLVKEGSLREDVFQELVRINSATDMPRTSSQPKMNAITRTSLTLIGRPISLALRGGFEQEEDSVAVTDGWLFTRKEGGKESWNRHFVVLSYTGIEWATSENGPFKKSSRLTLKPEQRVRRLPDDVLAFEIYPHDDAKVPPMQFSAHSEADVRRWIAEITRVIELLRGATEKDLPVLLNRPSRSKSQVDRDFLAREYAARRLQQERDSSNGSNTEARKTPIEEQEEDDASSSAISILDESQMDEMDKEELEARELLKQAYEERKMLHARIQALVEAEDSLSEHESKVLSDLQAAKNKEVQAFDAFNKLKHDEKTCSDQLTKLEADQLRTQREFDNFRGASSTSSALHAGPSRALQKLLSRDGISVENNPTAEKLNQLALTASNAKKSLQTEREKLKRIIVDKTKAETQLKNARTHVANALKLAQDLSKKKRDLTTTLTHQQDALMIQGDRVEQLKTAIKTRQSA